MNALVTGASRGIGRAIATELADRGVRLAVHYHQNHAAAESCLAGLAGAGHRTFAADMADSAAVERLWHDVQAAFGAIDILVNNAGVFQPHPPLETTYAAWQEAWAQTLAANLLGPSNLAFFAARAMARAGRGRIVNISSRGAFRGEPRAPAYGASKAGLNSMSQSLARALAPRGVYVYCLAPGWTETDMAAPTLNSSRREEIVSQHPLGRITQAEEVARAAVFCALDAPAAMTGSIIDVNGASYLRT